MEKNPRNLTFLDHLEEFRWRFIWSLVAWAVGCAIIYPWTRQILDALVTPVGHLVFVSPAEGFLSFITVLAVCGLILASPVIFYELWAFAGEALFPQERKFVAVFGPMSLFLFVFGAAFCYAFVVPWSMGFFLSFATERLTPMITVGKYIQYVAFMCLSFGLVFEMPLLFVFLTQVGIATPEFLIQKRRHAIVAIFVVSAILTPPDYVSQILMAIPLMGLYEISIHLSKWISRRKQETRLAENLTCGEARP